MRHLKVPTFSLLIILSSFYAKAYSLSVDEFFAKAEELSSLPFYDEVWDENDDPREAYAPYADRILEVEEDLEFINWFQGTTLEEFLKDNILIQYPRVLTLAENDLLQKGVNQRALALSKYLEKRFSSDLKERKQIYKLIPRKTLKAIEERNYESYPHDADHNYQDISFWYGPDIIRGPDGKFYIIEDNLSYIGGVGDLELASQSFVKNDPNYGLSVQCGSDFFDQLTEKYKKMAADKGGVPVIIRYPFSWASDNEEKRIQKLFRERGIKVVKIKQKNKEANRTIEVTDECVFYINKKKNKREKVGLVIINGEFSDFDATTNTSLKKYVMDSFDGYIYNFEENIKKIEAKTSLTDEQIQKKVAKLKTEIEKIEKIRAEIVVIDQKRVHKIKKTLRQNGGLFLIKDLMTAGFPGLIEAYSSGKVALVNGPGTESLNDKQFYLFVEDLIRNFTDEEPIINNIPTMSFVEKDGSLNEDLFTKVFAKGTDGLYIHQDELVIKKVVGRGGDSVWVGPKIDDEEFGSLEEKVKENPSDYIVQVYFALSQLQGYLVDLRYITDVSPAPYKTIVAPFPWGRGVLAEGSNGKVNISDKGGETAVFIQEETAAA